MPYIRTHTQPTSFLRKVQHKARPQTRRLKTRYMHAPVILRIHTRRQKQTSIEAPLVSDVSSTVLFILFQNCFTFTRTVDMSPRRVQFQFQFLLSTFKLHRRVRKASVHACDVFEAHSVALGTGTRQKVGGLTVGGNPSLHICWRFFTFGTNINEQCTLLPSHVLSVSCGGT